MNIHNIPDGLKVGRFCLTLVGEARLWCESLQPIANDRPALQDQFRQQYSKIGNSALHNTINIVSFSHLLKRVDFDAIVDHLALTHIIKSKVEPATTRIKRLLELISSYSFNLYYMKGKDMILSDFLSRQKNNDSNPHKIIAYLLIWVKSWMTFIRANII